MRLALLLLLAAGACAPPREAVPPALRSLPAPLPTFRAIGGVLEQGGFIRGVASPGTLRLTLGGAEVPLAADGGFFAAFGRDAPAVMVLSAEGEGGAPPAELRLDIRPRAFPEDRLPARLSEFTADPGFEARRAAELASIAAARAQPSAQTSTEDGWRQTFILPAEGRVSGVFGSQRFYGDEAQSPHTGLDIAAPPGTQVVAPAPGVVVLASPPLFSLEGNLVILDHGLGVYSSFLHLSRVDVHTGQRLQAGEIIGLIGATGRVTGPHLHWGMIWQGVRFDPATLISPLPKAR